MTMEQAFEFVAGCRGVRGEASESHEIQDVDELMTDDPARLILSIARLLRVKFSPHFGPVGSLSGSAFDLAVRAFEHQARALSGDPEDRRRIRSSEYLLEDAGGRLLQIEDDVDDGAGSEAEGSGGAPLGPSSAIGGGSSAAGREGFVMDSSDRD